MKNVRNLEACEQGGQGQEEASGGVCRGGRLGEAGRSAVEGRCRTAGGQRTNSPRISTAAGVGVCCGSCARGLRLCEQREREVRVYAEVNQGEASGSDKNLSSKTMCICIW